MITRLQSEAHPIPSARLTPFPAADILESSTGNWSLGGAHVHTHLAALSPIAKVQQVATLCVSHR